VTKPASILTNPAEDYTNRIAADTTIGDLRDRSSIPLLLEVLGEGKAELAWACSHALIAIRSRTSGRRLIEIARTHPSSEVRQAAIYAIWILGEVRAENALITIADLVSEDTQVRSLATEALGNTVHHGRSQRALARRLFDPSAGVRYSALCALSAYGKRLPRLLIGALTAKLDDPDRLDENRVIARLARKILNRCF
jgi:HEAT repeat protein